jgi:hypothetical protein
MEVSRCHGVLSKKLGFEDNWADSLNGRPTALLETMDRSEENLASEGVRNLLRDAGTRERVQGEAQGPVGEKEQYRAAPRNWPAADDPAGTRRMSWREWTLGEREGKIRLLDASVLMKEWTRLVFKQDSTVYSYRKRRESTHQINRKDLNSVWGESSRRQSDASQGHRP